MKSYFVKVFTCAAIFSAVIFSVKQSNAAINAPLVDLIKLNMQDRNFNDFVQLFAKLYQFYQQFAAITL